MAEKILRTEYSEEMQKKLHELFHERYHCKSNPGCKRRIKASSAPCSL